MVSSDSGSFLCCAMASGIQQRFLAEATLYDCILGSGRLLGRHLNRQNTKFAKSVGQADFVYWWFEPWPSALSHCHRASDCILILVGKNLSPSPQTVQKIAVIEFVRKLCLIVHHNKFKNVNVAHHDNMHDRASILYGVRTLYCTQYRQRATPKTSISFHSLSIKSAMDSIRYVLPLPMRNWGQRVNMFSSIHRIKWTASASTTLFAWCEIDDRVEPFASNVPLEPFEMSHKDVLSVYFPFVGRPTFPMLPLRCWAWCLCICIMCIYTINLHWSRPLSSEVSRPSSPIGKENIFKM